MTSNDWSPGHSKKVHACSVEVARVGRLLDTFHGTAPMTNHCPPCLHPSLLPLMHRPRGCHGEGHWGSLSWMPGLPPRNVEYYAIAGRQAPLLVQAVEPATPLRAAESGRPRELLNARDEALAKNNRWASNT